MTDSAEPGISAAAPARAGAAAHGGSAHSVLDGGGAMGALMRSVDWAATPIGAVATWPPSLRTVLGILLASAQPVFVFWGPQMVQFYNDAYRPILGTKMHPAAMGQLAHDCWADIWPVVKPMFDQVFAGGATNIKDGPLFLGRSGFLEECFFDYAFNPIRDESGAVAGIFVVANETTARVIGARRLGVLRDLSLRLALARNVDGVFRTVEQVLAQAAADLPFALLYEVAGSSAKLVANVGLARATPAAPAWLTLAEDGSWPLGAVAASGHEIWVDGLDAAFAPLVAAPWPEPVTRALVLPLAQGDGGTSAMLVVGLSPRLPPDDDYRSFVQLLARQIAVSLSSARAYAQEAQRAADLARLDRAKIAFFSNVSHEFRTPLTLILGSLDCASAQPSAVLSGEQIDVVRRNALRLAKLVNTLLDFSRIEAGRLQARFQPTDLSALTTDLASAFRSLIEKAGLTLTVHCPPLAEPVFVDREMVEKIVLNLLSNAFKFTLSGTISVSLEARVGHVRLVVADTGLGIAEAEQAHVFERFHRVKGAKGRSYEGSGIGLALVREMATLLGGTVAVESRLGQGSRFTLCLPLGSAHVPAAPVDAGAAPVDAAAALVDATAAPASADAAGPATAAFLDEASAWLATPTSLLLPPTAQALDAEPARPPGPHAGAHILLADDNADMREYVRRLLAAQGWQVEEAADGDQALARARLRVPDLVLTDVMMPGLDGFGLLAALRADERTRAVPVVMLSARASEEAAIEGLQHGADDYIVKPFSANALVSRVAARLDIARASAQRLTREQAIRAEVMAERQKLLSLFMQAPIAIAILEEPRLTFVFANPAYRALVGGRDVLDQPLLEVLPELAGQGLDTIIETVMTTGVPFIGTEIPVNLDRTGTGTREDLHFNVVYSPRRGASGGVDGVLVWGIDVTEQVAARRLIETLLAQLKLADRRKDEFLAMLAHELRNPLAAIGAAVDVLARLDGKPVPSRVLDIVRRQSKQLARLVDDLLDVSRVTEGKVLLQRRTTAVADFVQQAVDACQTEIAGRRHSLSVAIDAEPLFVDGDPVRLTQIITNLLQNAAKYTPEGGQISVQVRRQGAQVEIAVRDNGVGITAEALPHVFDLFVQDERPLSRAQGGLGIGLTVVQRMVGQHGGTVQARSDGRDRGSEFIVSLPAVKAPGSAKSAPGNGLALAPLAARILIVEDNIDTGNSLAEMLRLSGHDVDIVLNGPSGLDRFEQWAPQVVLCDIGLPGLDGYEVVARMRKIQHEPKPLLIALTGYGGPANVTRALLAGFDHHVVKPGNAEAILRLIDAAMRAGSRPR